MIIDLHKFVSAERPFWSDLETMLSRLENDPASRLSLDQLRQFHYLYERASSDLGKIMTFSAEPEIRRYLENLVGRAYGEIHETREKHHRLSPLHWFFQTWPQTFRRHHKAFWLSVGITIAGVIFGGFAMAFDPEAKAVILPEMFSSHLGDPAERVAREERAVKDRLAGAKGSFSAFLMRNNITVSIKALALGMTWGIGTIVVLFYNGVILGLICVDYASAGYTKFLLGWLMPHGVIEIPAILIAGQAGLVLAKALIGWGERSTMPARLRAIGPDLVTLIGGVAVMLVWAGFIEAFLSQYHQPIIPYSAKIGFGTVELVLLVLFLAKAGSGSHERAAN
ncbi:MAG TPA: stage II sporulation protein M [Verrucomicrobiae bacterium]|nr:stage II sporulation protein M [Verrucomicrobiae bacterium]